MLLKSRRYVIVTLIKTNKGGCVMLNLVYYLGILACGIQGSRKAIEQHYNILHIIVCALLASFAGGFIRDTLILNTHPAVLELDSMLDILLAMCSALVYEKSKHKELWFSFAKLSDSMALSQFVVRGVDRAISQNASSCDAFISGVATALGGGVISSLYACKSMEDICFSSLTYWSITLNASSVYLFFRTIGIGASDSQIILLAYTTVSVSMCNSNGKFLAKSYITRTIHCLKQNLNDHSYMYFIPYYTWHTLYRLHDEQQYIYNMQYYSSKKIVYMLHRIRQM